jgi:hypothetical protein
MTRRKHLNASAKLAGSIKPITGGRSVNDPGEPDEFVFRSIDEAEQYIATAERHIGVARHEIAMMRRLAQEAN